ncbi:MAG: hypothetical protein ACRDTE_13430 [Pseudonocardiaceae bacterium]
MYSWIWRKLPGSTGLRVVQAVVLVTAVVAVLLFVVFPRVDRYCPTGTSRCPGSRAQARRADHVAARQGVAPSRSQSYYAD